MIISRVFVIINCMGQGSVLTAYTLNIAGPLIHKRNIQNFFFLLFLYTLIAWLTPPQ